MVCHVSMSQSLGGVHFAYSLLRPAPLTLTVVTIATHVYTYMIELADLLTVLCYGCDSVPGSIMFPTL
uniref:Secreted protein n=1 Tax=Heterorhabditis bacteriophora TaxID=37862 RepID=A0A1I7X9V9_HETBA